MLQNVSAQYAEFKDSKHIILSWGSNLNLNKLLN